MKTTILVCAIVAITLAAKIPLTKVELDGPSVKAMKHYLLTDEFHSRMLEAEHILPIKDFMNTQYMATVSIGTPAQDFTVIPDTGSSNLWVYSHDCWAVPCWSHPTFKYKDSTTFSDEGKAFDIQYGSGSVKGTQGKDVVSFGGENVKDFEFGLIKKVSGASFLVSKMAGILGLAYQSISVNSDKVFFDQIPETDHSFSFLLGSTDEESHMIIPGFDKADFSGEFTTHKVVEEKYWALNLTGAKQGDTVIDVKGTKGVIDSGTSLIVGNKDLVDKLTAGITVKKDCSGQEGLPNITFTIDSTDYVLEPKDYIVKITQGTASECLMGIMGSKFPAGFDYIILGDVLMRKYYSHFDKINNTVSFATAVHTPAKTAAFLE
jgi:hypothetical protein